MCRCLREQFSIEVHLFNDVSFVLFRVKHVTVVACLATLTLVPFVSVDPLVVMFLVNILYVVCAFLKNVRKIV